MSGRGRCRGLLARWLGRDRASEPDTGDDGRPVPIADVATREHLTVQGRVRALAANPGSGQRWLEAELSDGTGTVTVVWMGRRRIAGVTVGRTLRVTGLIGEHRGRRVIYNPRYELLA
ncbi:OB-fold nucleic acid binding domain-containing protein [Propionibacterium australiense]|uniref:DNA-binding protein n=1 Tax=Propionibacterium australiense TaxID=119981 RepID=A0A383S624_9ACTN|nr:OB-fold nucleic acid binding domain-containing protein [Propionibacterium australiense]RLP10676.1 DNA-binding protein [Propionibacterium australiense]RLP12971.1 DNA-binding protein [Propionibacterium australiense]SYZ32884.1 OB-fold nucleic acid binding domain [Propionibacterium australiense]VEH91060.1 OB-fold nucleic acid binding domain [Propionibacterium australiense]